MKGLPLQMWDCRIHTSADTNPKYNLILFKRDHLPQRHADEHSNSSGMSLQVLTENCFIAQKGQEYNKSFWGSLIFLTFTTLVVNSILLWRIYPAQRLLLNAPRCLHCSAEFGHIWGARSQQMCYWPSEVLQSWKCLLDNMLILPLKYETAAVMNQYFVVQYFLPSYSKIHFLFHLKVILC